MPPYQGGKIFARPDKVRMELNAQRGGRKAVSSPTQPIGRKADEEVESKKLPKGSSRLPPNRPPGPINHCSGSMCQNTIQEGTD